jgi:hypothetical protein
MDRTARVLPRNNVTIPKAYANQLATEKISREWPNPITCAYDRSPLF